MNIFLTQFWTEKLLTHKPQPRHNKIILYKLVVIVFFVTLTIGLLISSEKAVSMGIPQIFMD